ncbi:Protein yobA [Burkholderia vietnamiensis]|nr:Protein yobA [Burkholderia vietnamiensis]
MRWRIAPSACARLVARGAKTFLFDRIACPRHRAVRARPLAACARANARGDASNASFSSSSPIGSTNMKITSFVRGALVVAGFVIAQAAHAHAHPKTLDPAADATLASAPHEVAIDFSETLEPAFSSIVVTDSHGQSVADGKSAVDAGNRKRMHVALASLAAGTYTVAWVAVASDGHRTQGRYTFTVK